MRGRVLVVAGSDSGGGAGIQGDIKTITALGGYAMTAITALTAQNTRGVFAVEPVPAGFVALQMRLCLEDIGADCLKIGMLHRADVIAAVADTIDRAAAGVPVVLDPVMLAKGGDALLAADAVDLLRQRLLPRATVLTPNVPEAEALTGAGEGTEPKALAAALLAQGPAWVLLKGGHRPGDTVTDLLAGQDGTRLSLSSPRLPGPHTHGTGCTLASAVATGIAQDLPLADAVRRAHAYVFEAIRHAPAYGTGHGPLNHGYGIAPTPSP